MKSVTPYLRKHFAKIYFALMSLVIFLPLLGRGYILTLDMIFTPNMHFPVSNFYGIFSETARDALLHSVSQIIPSDLVQKLLLLGIFFMIGYFMYRLLIGLTKRRKLFALTAATLYMWNPFTYTRLLAGHWAFLLGYALLPLFIIYVIKFYKTKQFSNHYLLIAALIWFVATLTSVHHLILMLIPVLSIGLIYLLTTKRWERIIGRIVVLTLLILLFNSSWLLPSLFNGNAVTVGENNLLYFSPTPDIDFGLTFNLASFYGFWAEQNLGLLPKQLNGFWWLTSLVLMAVTVLPILKIALSWLFPKRVNGYKKSRFRLIVSLLLLSAVGIVLAHGSIGFMQQFWNFFFNKIPILQPFRETQKFLSLYIFGFAVLFFFGLHVIQSSIYALKKERGYFAHTNTKIIYYLTSFLLLALVFFYTYTFPLGAAGQLKLSTYPESWQILEETVSKSERLETILVLPWQAYGDFSFIGRRTADPAPGFFSGYVVSEQIPSNLREEVECDVEFAGIRKLTALGLCLNFDSSETDWIDQIKRNEIDYVVLNNLPGAETYGFLNDKEHFELLFSDEHALVYEVL
ncbi:MAG: hypothetical protein ACE5DX_04790 [Candidatus Dojkabacteria bacterium]